MLAEILTYTTATTWILFSLILYGLHYLIEVVLDLPIAGESPCAAHASLKNLIQRFIREASELPDLHKPENDEFAAVAKEDTSTPDRTYEDLLSTAIINKVVQNYQEKAPSQATSSSKPQSKQNTSESEYFRGEQNLNRCVPDDTSSISSLDDYISTSGSTKYFDQMNLAIQESIKEVSSSYQEEVPYDRDNDIDEVDNMDRIDAASIRSNDWQENWYLRKRNFASGTNSPVPVPMLVPNPTMNAKVLIGDQEVEDTSDLSDAMSDYEESAEPSSLNAVLVNSKSIIGGRNPLESLVAKAESITDNNNITQVQVHYPADDTLPALELSSVETPQKDDIVETCNEVFIRSTAEIDAGACADTDEHHSLISLESNTEKDSEYTEKYPTLPRKIPMPTPRQSKLSEIEFTKASLLIEDSKADNGDSGVTSDEDDKQKSFKSSSYGEREKEKWNHAVELPNNPYSKSNLETRLSNRSSSVSSLNSDISALDSVVDTANVESDTDLVPALPKSPLPDMSKSKSLFDVFNDDRQGYKHRFGPDYFAKAAGKPKGALKDAQWLQDDGLDGDADDEERKPSPPPEIVDDPIVPKENLFRAVPALIQDPHDPEVQQVYEQENSSLEFTSTPTTTKRHQPWDFSSDSDYSIERTYNVNSGKIVKKLGDIEYEVSVSEQVSAEGLKYIVKEFDENQNTLSDKSLEDNRKKFLRSLTLDEEDVHVTTPTANHFKLVDEIANETSAEYHVVPISPPAEYRNEIEEEAIFKTIEERKNDLNLSKEKLKDVSIEYESFEKSYEFSIEDVYEEEQQEQVVGTVTCTEISETKHESAQSEQNYETNEDIIEEESCTTVSCPNPIVPQKRSTEDVLEHGWKNEPEIDMLKEQQLVRQRLGAFSKSFPNLQPSISEDHIEDVNNYSSDLFANEIEIKDASIEPVPSVQCLKKRFENDSDIKKEVHSLTARSLPKHVREELAAQTNQPLKPHRISSLSETSNEAAEEEHPIEVIQLPKARSTIAFFEQMSKK